VHPHRIPDARAELRERFRLIGYGHDAVPASMHGRFAPAHGRLGKLLRSFPHGLKNSARQTAVAVRSGNG
jgi:hypothetical protein